MRPILFNGRQFGGLIIGHLSMDSREGLSWESLFSEGGVHGHRPGGYGTDT